MKKFSSNFNTFGFCIEHNEADASDVTDQQLIKELRQLIKNIEEDGWQAWMLNDGTFRN